MYLNLTERKIWQRKRQRDIRIGDLVLVVDENVPRGRWNLGRVIKTFPGDDDLVRAADVQTKNGVHKRPVVKL